MSTIFVLIVYIYSNSYVNIREFDTMEKCFTAAMEAKLRENKEQYVGKTINTVCFKIEK